MTVEQIQAVVVEPSLAPLPSAAKAAHGMPGAHFGQLVSQGLERVDTQLMAAQNDLQQLALGQGESLHQVMIRMEEARLSFQLMMQVRNRVLEAYQDVMRMQL
jgi:flagellar hook-basal body complex protein FliE